MAIFKAEKEGHHMSEIPLAMTACVLRGVADLVLEERGVASVRTADKPAAGGAA